MALSAALNDADLELTCHKCGHVSVRKGSWIKVSSSFKCESCGGRNRIGYPEKVAIFEKYAALSRRSLNAEACGIQPLLTVDVV